MFFVGRDAEDEAGEIAGAQSIEQLRQEMAALRQEIQRRLGKSISPKN